MMSWGQCYINGDGMWAIPKVYYYLGTVHHNQIVITGFIGSSMDDGSWDIYEEGDFEKAKSEASKEDEPKVWRYWQENMYYNDGVEFTPPLYQ